MAGKQGHRGFGYIRHLPSGKWQASYLGPDRERHTGPTTYQTKELAGDWLTDEKRLIERDEWSPPGSRKAIARATSPTLAEFSERWVRERTTKDDEPLRPRTRQHYRALLDHHVNPVIGHLTVKALTTEDITAWYAGMDPTKKTLRAHAFVLLRSIMASAAAPPYSYRRDNPVPTKKGAGTTKRAKKIKPATLGELELIATNMPAKYRPMVMLASWCALRFGELTELRRKDLDLTNGIVHVRRGVVRADGQKIVGDPKSEAGKREVAIPPHLIPMLHEHRDSMPTRAPDALLFPATDGVSHIAPSSLYRVYYPARAAAGRPDLRWHDLRHTGATLAAQTGATMAELMSRLGHSTQQAALRYQHAAKDRDAEIARLLSKMVEAES